MATIGLHLLSRVGVARPEHVECSYLSWDEVEQFAGLINEYPLLPYALDHTKSHLSAPHNRQRLMELGETMKASGIRLLLGPWINGCVDSEESADLTTKAERTRFANSVLHVAAAQRLVTAVSIALKAGADPNSRSVLHASGEAAPCRLALFSSKEPEADGPAARAEQTTCRLLIAYGAECVKALVEADADQKAGDNQGHMPIHWAAGLKNRTSILELLIEWHTAGERERPRKPSKQTKRASHLRCLYKDQAPLHWATRYGHTFALAKLLDVLRPDARRLKDAVDKRELDGRTPLIWACQWGHIECVKLLIEAEADADVNLGQVATLGARPFHGP
ncbi:Serine/threonine-protein phosphatase 6 regulatory ankyrin repeat subunit A [Neonectria punicea]|uniref:Serine/threonine-protein phosphatase 6 regulatory ankyrin repeat subunit A n=1 Tax=Neonectria punicea TaxID=979145 RepID=A0ABR1HV10_9HYPO